MTEEPCHMPIGWNQLCTLPGDHPHDDGCETPLPPYSRKPITLPDGTPVIGWSGPAIPRPVKRCWCGRPIPPDSISYCGCCCTEHDDPGHVPARFDERYDPSPDPIDRSIS